MSLVMTFRYLPLLLCWYAQFELFLRIGSVGIRSRSIERSFNSLATAFRVSLTDRGTDRHNLSTLLISLKSKDQPRRRNAISPNAPQQQDILVQNIWLPIQSTGCQLPYKLCASNSFSSLGSWVAHLCEMLQAFLTLLSWPLHL